MLYPIVGQIRYNDTANGTTEYLFGGGNMRIENISKLTQTDKGLVYMYHYTYTFIHTFTYG